MAAESTDSDTTERIYLIEDAHGVLPPIYAGEDNKGLASLVVENFHRPPHQRFSFSTRETYGEASVVSARQWLRASSRTLPGVIAGREYPDPAELSRVVDVIKANEDVDVHKAQLPKVHPNEDWLTEKPQRKLLQKEDLQEVVRRAQRRFQRRRLSESLLINRAHVSPAEVKRLKKSDEEMFSLLVATEALFAIVRKSKGTGQYVIRAEDYGWNTAQHRRLAQSPADYLCVHNEFFERKAEPTVHPHYLVRVVRPGDEVDDLLAFIHTSRWLQLDWLLV